MSDKSDDDRDTSDSSDENAVEYLAEIVWKMENIKSCIHKKNEKISSEKFSVPYLGDSELFLDFYPRGDETSDNMAIFLRRGETTSKSEDSFDIEISLTDDASNPLQSKTISIKAFNSKILWGWSTFIDNKDLDKVDLSVDVLCICCNMWKSNESVSRPTKIFLRTKIPTEKQCFDWCIEKFSEMDDSVSDVDTGTDTDDDSADADDSDADDSNDDNKKKRSVTTYFTSPFDSKKPVKVTLCLYCFSSKNYLKVIVTGGTNTECSLKLDIRFLKNEVFLLSTIRLSKSPYIECFQPEFIFCFYKTRDVLVLNCELTLISHKIVSSLEYLSLKISEPMSVSFMRVKGKYKKENLPSSEKKSIIYI